MERIDFGEPWRPGFGYSSIITDRAPAALDGSRYRLDKSYGGHLVAEGFTRDMMLRACACVNAMAGVADEDLGTVAAIVEALRHNDYLMSGMDAIQSLRDWADRNGYVRIAGLLPAPPIEVAAPFPLVELLRIAIGALRACREPDSIAAAEKLERRMNGLPEAEVSARSESVGVQADVELPF